MAFSAPPRERGSSATTPPTGSALTAATADEDWTKITDQASRKKIQNRLAQRNYRSSLKRRIEELERQEALADASHERNQDSSRGQGQFGHNDYGGDDASNSSGSDRNLPSRTPSSNGMAAPSPPYSNNSQGQAQVPANYYIPSSQVEHSMKFPQQYVDQHTPYSDMNHSMFPPALAGVNYHTLPVMSGHMNRYHGHFLPNSQDKLPSSRQEGLFDASSSNKIPPPQNPAERRCAPNTQNTQSNHNSIRDPFRIPSEDIWDTDVDAMFHEQSPPPPLSSGPTSGGSRAGAGAGASTAMENMFPASSYPLTPQSAFTPNLPHAQAPEVNNRKPDNYSKPGIVHMTSTPATTPLLHPLREDDLEPILGNPSPSLPPRPENASLDDRFDYILECVRMIGFDSFDSMVSAYYTAEFKESSLASNVRKVSRNRRLPGVLSDLRESTKTWTPWEMQGYRDEIIKSSEEILIQEKRNFVNNKQSISIIPDLRNRREGSSDMLTLVKSTPSDPNGRAVSQSIIAATKVFQNEMPNLWALVTALTTDNIITRQRDQSQVVLAIISLLTLSGRLPHDQLEAWIRRCLATYSNR